MVNICYKSMYSYIDDMLLDSQVNLTTRAKIPFFMVSIKDVVEENLGRNKA